MNEDDKILQIISNETKKATDDMDILTPSIYSSIFSKLASLHNCDLTEEKNITDNMLNNKITLLENMQNQTSKNVQVLSESTDKAITAIKDKDEKLLEEVSKETQELKKEIQQLKDSMHKDELTNSYNRKWLNDNILNEEGKSFNSSGILAMIDLNYFKEINDTHGHIIGDKVLIFIANQLKKTREQVVRYGGDEFIVVFSHNVKEESAISELNSIRESILHKHMKVKDSSFKVSFSFGTQKFEKTDSLIDVIEKADKNMYNDKKEIKKRVPGI